MSRYIDADALKESMHLYGFRSVDLTVTEFIEDVLPTADVREVVHGEWIDKGEDYMIRWTCSNCGRRDTHIYDFCPDCGADMRGENNELHK